MDKSDETYKKLKEVREKIKRIAEERREEIRRQEKKFKDEMKKNNSNKK